MRELRKDIDMTLESSKEEIDNADEIKIEDVLMGLKGLKQEEVFSFLGKNNFSQAETEMSSTGFSGYDQLASVDSAEMEQLQLSFNAHFDGLQGSNGHTILRNSYISKSSNSDLKLKIKCDSNFSASKLYNGPFINVSRTNSDNIYDWSTKKDRYEDIQHQQRIPSMWPKYPGTHDYSLADYHVENYREEEIIATSMGEELISSTNVEDEDEFKYSPCNTYVIQSSADGADKPDKSKSIKLRIKRVESEDEVFGTLADTDSPVTRTKSKRVWNSSTKRKTEVIACGKKRKCTEKFHKFEMKTDSITATKKKEESLEELDFPFSNTVHQDDDFVYPSLDLSDDEEDGVYSFNQRDDETWTPKIKMKINEVKTERPIRNRKRNNAVAKCLEAAALRHADSDTSDKVSTSKSDSKFSETVSLNIRKAKTVSLTNQVVIDDRSKYMCNDLNYSKSNVDSTFSLPSTSNAFRTSSPSSCCTFSSLSSPNELSVVQTTVNSELSMSSPPIVRRGRKAKAKSSQHSNSLLIKSDSRGSRLISPKTCKLIQTPRGPVMPSVPQNSASKRIKSESNSSSSSYAVCNNEKKSPSSSYITKRGKPKKGMATAKQRLGKILKMHKMFF